MTNYTTLKASIEFTARTDRNPAKSEAFREVCFMDIDCAFEEGAISQYESRQLEGLVDTLWPVAS